MPYIEESMRCVERLDGAGGMPALARSVSACVGEGLFTRALVVRGAAAALINRAVARPGQLIFPIDAVVACLRDTGTGREVEQHAVALGAAVEKMSTARTVSVDGLLNYLLTRLMHLCYPFPRYHDFNEIIGVFDSLLAHCDADDVLVRGVLRCCQLEYYRKYAAPYEDAKEAANGVVERT